MFERLVRARCHSTSEVLKRIAGQLLEKLYGCEIQCERMHESVRFAHHARGCTIVAAAILEDVVIFQNVSMGANLRFNRHSNEWENVGNPIVAKGVIVCDGAKILGPVVIGENSVVAAGAIVTKSIPPNSIAFGVNQYRARDPKFDLVFRKDMIGSDAMVEENPKLVADFDRSRD